LDATATAEECPIPNDLERWLRESSPKPPDEFVRELETRLFPAPPPRRASLLASAATAVALTAVAVVFGVLGLLPSALEPDRPATATERCRTVMVERTVRRPLFVTGRDGELVVRYHREVVKRPVKRCN
jgi:hypothetical protein